MELIQFIEVLACIVLPPLAVAIHSSRQRDGRRVCAKFHFWLNIILSICGFIPGIIHAILYCFFCN